MRGGDHLAALKAFDRVVMIAPYFAEGWNKRATVHYLAGNLDQSLDDIAITLSLERALVAFEAALAVYPHMVGPRINAEAIRQILGQEI